MRLFTIALVAGVMAMPAAGIGAETRGGAAAGRGPAADRQVAFEERIASFIGEFYLTGERRSVDDLERLYAARVDYFGGRRLSRSQVISDKRAYYRRWPTRSYSLVRDTLSVVRRQGDARVFDISFEYTYSVAAPTRWSRGRGLAMLTMDLDQDGGRITRETGRVLERW